MNTPITWRPDDPSVSPPATNLLRDEAFESRLTSLRDVALELLSAVETLKTQDHTRTSHKINLYDEVRRFESDLINAALIRTRGNQARAARLLGVKHTTLNAKIKRYGISTDSNHSAGELSDREIAA